MNYAFAFQDSQIVAYFFRKYAMEKALSNRGPSNSPETQNFLLSLMSQLEKDKSLLINAGTSLADGKVIYKRQEFLFDCETSQEYLRKLCNLIVQRSR